MGRGYTNRNDRYTAHALVETIIAGTDPIHRQCCAFRAAGGSRRLIESELCVNNRGW